MKKLGWTRETVREMKETNINFKFEGHSGIVFVIMDSGDCEGDEGDEY